jgi:tetratricopeptide (TPR) repeat protein
MRLALGLIVGLLLALLGIQQAISDVLARDAARPGSLIAHVRLRVDPRWPLLPLQRLLLARRDLAAGDLRGAEYQATLLAHSRDRLELEAQLAERRGDRATASAKYFAAGDAAGLEATVTRMEKSGDFRQALTLQRAIVGQLAQMSMQSDALAEGWWRLAVLYAILGDRTPTERTSDYRAAIAADERAIELAPFSQKYLLNAAYRAVGLGELERATMWYDRVRATNPKSVDAMLGLAKVALLRGHHDDARAELQTAQSIDPALPEISKLLRQLQQ